MHGDVDKNLVYDAYKRMSAQDEKLMHETNRVRRAQQRCIHQRAENLMIVIHAAFAQHSFDQTTNVKDVPYTEKMEEPD